MPGDRIHRSLDDRVPQDDQVKQAAWSFVPASLMNQDMLDRFSGRGIGLGAMMIVMEKHVISWTDVSIVGTRRVIAMTAANARVGDSAVSLDSVLAGHSADHDRG